MSKLVVVLFALTLLAWIQRGTALKCHTCTSTQNGACADEFNGGVDIEDGCSYCSKIKSEDRSVTRSCGKGPVPKIKCEEGEEDAEFCTCDEEDLCNHSNTIVFSMATIILAVLATKAIF